MAHTLLLRLPAAGQEETEWLTIDDAGDAPIARQRGSLTLAAAVSRSGKVVALAPATQILLAEPELPPGSGVKLARAVPFALEEQLTEDIDQLSFAVGRRRSSGGTPVAVVSRTVLQEWLSALSAAGLEPLAMYPDMSLMPENPGQTVLWLEKTRLAVRRPGALPFAVELSPVSEALVVAGVIADPLDNSADPKVPESAVLYVTREDWAHSQNEFETLVGKFESLKVQLLPDGPLPWLARSLEGTEAVNLLQGEFARTTDFSARWRQWRTAALLAGGLAGRACRRRGTANSPRPARNGRARLADRRRLLRRHAGGNHQGPAPPDAGAARPHPPLGASPEYFLHVLQALSGALAVAPKTDIDSLSYREQSLDMKVSAPNLAALSQLTQFIGKQGKGMTAEIQSSTPVAGGVEAHIQVRGQSARVHR